MSESKTSLWQKKAARLLAAHQRADEILQAARMKAAEADAEKEAAREATAITAASAQEIQHKVHQRIAGIASRCLAAIFGDGAYELKCSFDVKRNKTEASFILCRDGIELENPQDAAGGGVVDVVAFALRCANIRFRRIPLRPLLVLDEPFKWLSKEHRPAVRQMIEEMSEELGIQFIIVTHDPEYIIGKVIEVGECQRA